jgi:BlaI family penicillinase repressor
MCLPEQRGEAMAERTDGTIQATEWDVLQALWTLERATAREVTEALEERRGWAYSTVKTMLDRMVKKELVEARRVGNVWEYSPGLAPEEARRGAWRSFIDTVFDGSMAPALRFLASDARLTRRQREQLLDLLSGEEASDA